MDAPDPDPILAAIAEEARRLVAGEVRRRVQGAGGDTVVVVEPLALAPYPAQRLVAHLRAFCAREGLSPRFLVVSGTQPSWVPKTPEGWPPEDQGRT